MKIRITPNLSKLLFRLSCAFAISVFMAGCANIPPHMRVTDGLRPENIDTDVRFRTTYYFRVYDYCYDAKSRSNLQPVSDSLYRFVMTGKANAYANQVRFESGTLQASQIDPFGATVEFDDDSGLARFVPEAEVQARARSNNARREIESLIELKRKIILLNSQEEGVVGKAAVNDTTLDALDKTINNLVANGLTPPSVADVSPSASPEAVLACPPGSEIQRGFQIMGPQGVKTFDQDARLIMAMSSNAKPLLSALEEVSGRFLKAEEEKKSSEAFLLSLVREQLRVSEMNRVILENQEPEKANTLFTSIKEKLEPTKEDNGDE